MFADNYPQKSLGCQTNLEFSFVMNLFYIEKLFLCNASSVLAEKIDIYFFRNLRIWDRMRIPIGLPLGKKRCS